LVNIDYYESGEFFKKRWETDTEKLFLSGKNGIEWINFAYMGMSMFPDEYA